MAAGDRRALADLYARYERPLRTYLRLLTPDPGLAEELLQDTLLAAWTGAHGYAGQASVQGWLLGIARRRAHDAQRRRALHLVDAAAWTRCPRPTPTRKRSCWPGPARRTGAAVARLAPVHREIFVLAFVHELSYQDLAGSWGFPLGTVKSRLSNAKRALRALLRPEDTQP